MLNKSLAIICIFCKCIIKKDWEVVGDERFLLEGMGDYLRNAICAFNKFIKDIYICK